MASKKLDLNSRLEAVIVEEYEVDGEKRTAWNRIGTAWPNKDGKGFRVVLKATPVDGVFLLRLPKEKED